MSKTYEAMTKSTYSSNDDSMKSSAISGWRFEDLKNSRQKGNLEKKIAFCQGKDSAKIFNFTSSRPKEGVSTIVGNLAKYLTNKKKDKKILLIDANLRTPVQHIAFNHQKGPGLCEILDGNASLSDAIQNGQAENVHLLPCGNPQPDSAGEIEQEQFRKLVSELKGAYDYILIDSAPLLISVDSLSTAVSADVTFLIIRSFKVQKQVAEKAKLLLQDNECKIGGVILNRVRQVIPEWMYRMI